MTKQELEKHLEAEEVWKDLQGNREILEQKKESEQEDTFNYKSSTMRQFQNANTCVCCGEIIPEGTQLCHKCQKGY